MQASAANLGQVPPSAQCLKEPVDQLHSMPPVMITFPPEKLLTRSVRHRTSKIDLPGVNPLPTHPLRRKKRMSFVRKISSCALRDRRFSQDPSSAPTASVRLGHPSRPYYTAIRKNMARPNSMPPPESRLIMSSLRPSPTRAKQRPRLLTRSSEDVSFSDVDPPAPVSPLRTGFSLSGETELRMVLSKSRTNKGEYRFRETSPPARGRRTAVKRKVQILGKGLRELVCGWTCE